MKSFALLTSGSPSAASRNVVTSHRMRAIPNISSAFCTVRNPPNGTARPHGVEHAAQERGIDHTHRPAVGEHDVLSSEVAAAVGELKAKPGRELQVHGSDALFRWLLDDDLVDEINLFSFPVVVGQGTRGCSPTPART
jgi:riboflavin biosynthesis pyrimidine reductase